jgi:hypothetical protein
MRDNKSNTQIVRLGKQTLSGTTANASAWVDMQGFDSCTIVLNTDTVTDAGDANGFTATLQHGDTSAAAGAAAVSSTDAVGGVSTVQVTLDTADNAVAGSVGYIGSKRYARLNIVGTTNTSAVVEAVAILTKAHRAPVTFIGTSVAAT